MENKGQSRGAEPWKGGKDGTWGGGGNGALPPRGPSELGSVYSCRWRKTNSDLIYMIRMSTSFRYTQDAPIFSPLRRPPKPAPASACAAPLPPLRLSVITVSLRSRHPPGGLNLLINLGFDCMHRSPHHELICIHTSTLVDVPTTR